LKREHGLTILYQYLHRYADAESQRLNDKFVQSVERISSDSGIIVQTVTSVMKRLRQIQGVFVVYQEDHFWIVNVNDEDIADLQIVANQPIGIELHDGNVLSSGCTLVVKTLPGNSVLSFRTSDHIFCSNKNSFAAEKDRHVSCDLPFGKLLINLDVDKWQIPGGDSIPPGSFLLTTRRGGTGIPILSSLPYREELALILDQSALIGREVILRRRSLSIEKYLDSSRQIPLENHENW